MIAIYEACVLKAKASTHIAKSYYKPYGKLRIFLVIVRSINWSQRFIPVLLYWVWHLINEKQSLNT